MSGSASAAGMGKRATVTIAVAIAVTGAAFGFRLFLAVSLPEDDDDDGRYYAQIARNLLDGRGYSGESEEPFVPTNVRVPAYPLFLAGVYRVFGRDDNGAVRAIQVLIDTLTCWLAALLALAWLPLDWAVARKRRTMLIALGLAAACPFTAVYVTTVLTETLAIMLTTAVALMATHALRNRTKWQWCACGVLAGAATMIRPDTALFAGGVGLTLVLAGLRDLRCAKSTIASGVVFVVSFAAMLAPWTIRNARAFGVFQPVAPLYANSPGEFAPVGYISWLRTWVDDERYVSPFEDALDLYPIAVEALPHKAFDSPEERERVASLLDRYNNAPPPASNDRDEEDAPGSGDNQAQDERFVRMTPEIDSGFADLAAERIRRHPLRSYLVLPVKRAMSLWFDSHSQNYPFDGELFPLYDLDTDKHQQYWLSAFVLLTWALTLLGLAGAVVLVRNRSTRLWVLLLILMVVPRLAFLSWQEHPESRYTVEFFPLVIASASIALAAGLRRGLRANEKGPGS